MKMTKIMSASGHMTIDTRPSENKKKFIREVLATDLIKEIDSHDLRLCHLHALTGVDSAGMAIRQYIAGMAYIDMSSAVAAYNSFVKEFVAADLTSQTGNSTDPNPDNEWIAVDVEYVLLSRRLAKKWSAWLDRYLRKKPTFTEKLVEIIRKNTKDSLLLPENAFLEIDPKGREANFHMHQCVTPGQFVKCVTMTAARGFTLEYSHPYENVSGQSGIEMNNDFCTARQLAVFVRQLADVLMQAYAGSKDFVKFSQELIIANNDLTLQIKEYVDSRAKESLNEETEDPFARKMIDQCINTKAMYFLDGSRVNEYHEQRCDAAGIHLGDYVSNRIVLELRKLEDGVFSITDMSASVCVLQNQYSLLGLAQPSSYREIDIDDAAISSIGHLVSNLKSIIGITDRIIAGKSEDLKADFDILFEKEFPRLPNFRVLHSLMDKLSSIKGMTSNISARVTELKVYSGEPKRAKDITAGYFPSPTATPPHVTLQHPPVGLGQK